MFQVYALSIILLIFKTLFACLLRIFYKQFGQFQQ